MSPFRCYLLRLRFSCLPYYPVDFEPLWGPLLASHLFRAHFEVLKPLRSRLWSSLAFAGRWQFVLLILPQRQGPFLKFGTMVQHALHSLVSGFDCIYLILSLYYAVLGSLFCVVYGHLRSHVSLHVK